MNKQRILFLLSHQPNPRFVKQIKYLSGTDEVSVIYYYRDYMKDLTCEYDNVCKENINIGAIPNGNYLYRIGKYLKSFLKIYSILKKNKFDQLIVNNIDTLLLFKLCTWFQKIPTQIVIEISDLRSHTYSTGVKAKLIRFIERMAFGYVNKLIVTSPKFYELYYGKFFKGEYFILENKPLSTMVPRKIQKKKNDKTIIGIVGLLLQGRPYQTLFEALGGDMRYEIHIYGKGPYQKLVEDYAQTYENIQYFGEYNFFQDSADIYASLDLLYMPYDTTNGSLNNKIALPNKLYEAMYFKVPIITSKGTYLGELVEAYGIGMVVMCCDSRELTVALNEMEFKNIQKNLDALDESLYLGDADYQRLQRFISKYNY